MLNAANQLTVPGYTIANIGASYTTRIGGRNTTFRAAINNVANRKYWEYQYDRLHQARRPAHPQPERQARLLGLLAVLAGRRLRRRAGF